MTGSARICPQVAQGARTPVQSSRASGEDLGLITLAAGFIPSGSKMPEGTISFVGEVGSAVVKTNGGVATLRWAPGVLISGRPSPGIATLLDWVKPTADVGGGDSSPPANGALHVRRGVLSFSFPP